jgi:hypothetical protein
MMIALAAAAMSFAAACARVSRQTGSPLGCRQGEELAVAAARDFEGFYAARAAQACAAGDILGLWCDGKGITMLPGQLRPDQQRKARTTVPGQDGR